MLVLNVLHFPALRFGASFSRPAFFSLYSLVVRHFQVLQIQLPISGIISTYYLNVILTDLTMTATNNDGHTMVNDGHKQTLAVGCTCRQHQSVEYFTL